jgi:beta-ureidopropionase / N-carbamoyl-L-amino-acid hydrolase
MDTDDFRRLWNEIEPIGRAEPAGGEPGGYVRFSWTEPDLDLRTWFHTQAKRRGLRYEEDRNGNLYAWWDAEKEQVIDPDAPHPHGAVLTGSHFDSVPHGGGYDGPLGIVSAFLAVDRLKADGAILKRPIGIAAFTEEEGGRFGVPCLGSRLMTGAIDPDRARALTDPDGVTLAEAMSEAGGEPDLLGPDPERVARLAAFIELHIEQGRALDGSESPVSVASAIWPHGRWRMLFTGTADHAGTTRLPDRRDPMLTFAFAVLAARKEARIAGGVATVGRVEVEPNATNAIASTVTAWLDARAPDEAVLSEILEGFVSKVSERAGRDSTGFEISPESETPIVEFDASLRDRIAGLLGGAPILPTAAGHDAGVLSAHVPTAMLFVRNPTGVSHAPGEAASDEDCAAGVAALAAVLRDLAC